MKNLLDKIDNVRALQLFQIVRFGSLLLINIAIVKLGMSSTEVGYFETALFLANVLTFFWVNGAVQSLLPMFPFVSGVKKYAEFFNVSLVLAFLSLLSGGVGFLFEGLFRQTQALSNYPLYSLAVLYTMLNGVGLINEYFYLLLNKPIKMLVYGIISFSLQIVCVLVPAILGLSVTYMLLGLIAVSVVRIIWLCFLLYKHSLFEVDLSFIKHWARRAIPLSLKHLVGNSGTLIDSLIITTFFSASVFAVYRYGAKDFPLTLLLANGLSSAMLPLFGRQLNGALTELRLRSRNLMNWLFPVSIALLFFAKPLFVLVFSADYEESALVFMIYILLISSRLLFPQTVAVGIGKTGVLLIISVIELAVNVGLSLLWLKPFGIEGIAMASVVAFMLDKILIAAYLYYKCGISPSQYIPTKTYSFWLVMLFIAYFLARFAI
jgi:O-antigen/teichoic acid export membrane protein